MKFEDIKKLIKIISYKNVKPDTIFDYLRIVKYKDDKIIKKNTKVLFFPITITESDKDSGWYNTAIDYRFKINEIATKNPDYYYVIEKLMIESMPDCSHYIVVENIMNVIDILFKYTLKEFTGKIICVTGSVGKTTTVGFISQVLGRKALRIYSKRITPLILKNYCINYLTNDYDYLVLEASLWYKEHIEYFSKTLHPDLAILLDIRPEHIGIRDINSINDITKFKAKLLEFARNAMINVTDKELAKLNIRGNKLYYKKEFICNTKINNLINITEMKKEIVPYIKTNLSILEETIAYSVGKYYDINDTIIINRLNKARTIEKRLEKEKLYNHKIIFDGDVSGVARLKELSNHYYKNAYLVISNLTTDGEETENYIELKKIFNNFNKVYINNKYYGYFKKIKNVFYYNDLDFIKNINPHTIIFLHYGSYYRHYNKFALNCLEE
jgi:hypothetical protein